MTPPAKATVITTAAFVRWWETNRVVEAVGLNGVPIEVYNPQCPDPAVPERPVTWPWLGLDSATHAYVDGARPS